MTVKQTKKMIQTIGFYPKKSLGQNFLTNEKMIQKIISVAKGLKPAFIIEVGPGLGALTRPLLRLKRPLKVVEYDPRLCQYWRDKVDLIEGDVLKVAWTHCLQPRSLLMGNLPYQVASRLMVDCSPCPQNLQFMILMLQKEVAQRVKAVPFSKTYGVLSVLLQCFWDIQILAEVSAKDFYPRPEVASRLLLFQKKPKLCCPIWSLHGPTLKNRKKTQNKQETLLTKGAFTHFVKLCFAQRRKLLLNRLKKHSTSQNVESVFNALKIPLLVRAEEINPQQFLQLFYALADTLYEAK